MRTDGPGNHGQTLPPQLRIVATAEWADILIEAIQNDLQSCTAPFMHTDIWAYFGPTQDWLAINFGIAVVAMCPTPTVLQH